MGITSLILPWLVLLMAIHRGGESKERVGLPTHTPTSRRDFEVHNRLQGIKKKILEALKMPKRIKVNKPAPKYILKMVRNVLQLQRHNLTGKSIHDGFQYSQEISDIITLSEPGNVYS